MFGASKAHSGLKEMLRLHHAGAAPRAKATMGRALTSEELQVALSGMPSPSFGSADARVYAFARQVFRDNGPSEASRLADLFVKNIQDFSRNNPYLTQPQTHQGAKK